MMRSSGSRLARLSAALALLAATGATPPHEGAQRPFMAWAYPLDPPSASPPTAPDRITRRRLPGSAQGYTDAALADLFGAPDWHPERHPPMPAIVAHGRKPDVMACGYCHLPTGNGRPENAALAGLPQAYIVAQMRAFRAGLRTNSVAGRLPMEAMSHLAKATTDEGDEAAAAYFARLPHRSSTRVVEAGSVPRTRIAGWIPVRDPAGGMEPLGGRIVEMPVDVRRFEQRDPDGGYVAYVPPGSLARGEALVRTWGPAAAFACAGCHGPQLRGTNLVPGIAGRSPSYLVRQLGDFRSGARQGPEASSMAAVAAPMGDAEIVAIAAYLATRR